jgi:hypothetical protein
MLSRRRKNNGRVSVEFFFWCEGVDSWVCSYTRFEEELRRGQGTRRKIEAITAVQALLIIFVLHLGEWVYLMQGLGVSRSNRRVVPSFSGCILSEISLACDFENGVLQSFF